MREGFPIGRSFERHRETAFSGHRPPTGANPDPKQEEPFNELFLCVFVRSQCEHRLLPSKIPLAADNAAPTESLSAVIIVHLSEIT